MTKIGKYGMISLRLCHQKVLFLSRRGNQVKSLNDPVTVSGSNIHKEPLPEGEKGDNAINRESGNLLSDRRGASEESRS